MWRCMPAPEEDSDEEADFDSEGEDGMGGGGGAAGGQFIADADAAAARDVIAFGKVVGDMVTSGHAEGHPASSLLMEIKGYKFAQNKVCITHLPTEYTFIQHTSYIDYELVYVHVLCTVVYYILRYNTVYIFCPL